MSIGKLIQYLIVWRLSLFFILFFALSTIPLQFNFLGGGLSSYLHMPYFWSSINYDGEHYLSIAQNGYKPLQYFFFPLYPLASGTVAAIIGKTAMRYAVSGLLVSHISLFFACYGLLKLVTLEFSTKIARLALLLFLLFPTSFYLVNYYTESLFLALLIWSFYFLRKGNWLMVALLGALLCSTRIVGVALIPALLVDAYITERKFFSKTIVKAFGASCVIALGIVFYMIFLERRTGDPFAFFTSLNMVYGAQRSDSFILLPQVFFRYFVRILPNLSYDFWPLIYTTYLEITTGLLFLVLSIHSFFRLRLSYATFMITAYIIPTLSGSFSSFPRYALVLLPGFILMALYLTKAHRFVQYLVFVIMGMLLFISNSLFVRGYWIS